jgi:flagellar hook assembly protein FlgD
MFKHDRFNTGSIHPEIFTGIDDEQVINLSGFYLHNYPNPFNPSTTISFNISRKDAKNAKIEIFNIKGQKVKTLVNEVLPAGEHSVVWDGRDYNNKRVNSGLYFYKFKVNGKTAAVKKCLLLK